MAVLTLQDGSSGVAASFVAATATGDQVPSGSEAGGWQIPVVLLAQNGDTVAHSVTVGSLPAVSIPAGEMAIIPVAGFVSIGDLVDVTYDAVTAVTVGAVALATGAIT